MYVALGLFVLRALGGLSRYLNNSPGPGPEASGRRGTGGHIGARYIDATFTIPGVFAAEEGKK